MFKSVELKKYLLTTLVCMAVAMANREVIAECESLQSPDFPSEDCSFNELGVNKQMVKFGYVDEVSGQSSSPISVRFGSAVYNISTAAEIHVVLDDDSCFSNTGSSGFDFDLLDIERFSPIPVDDVAFVPSSANPREIERIWVFRCSSVQFQNR